MVSSRAIFNNGLHGYPLKQFQFARSHTALQVFKACAAQFAIVSTDCEVTSAFSGQALDELEKSFAWIRFIPVRPRPLSFHKPDSQVPFNCPPPLGLVFDGTKLLNNPHGLATRAGEVMRGIPSKR